MARIIPPILYIHNHSVVGLGLLSLSFAPTCKSWLAQFVSFSALVANFNSFDSLALVIIAP